MKRVYKSKKNKIFAGVIGGVGEYFDIDPVILRLAWLLVVLFTGLIPGIIIYILSIFIVPHKLVTP
tara:strand:- start:362 stop:559 length:198 start_codon:yes stop_codon:yes gene_type:complete